MTRPATDTRRRRGDPAHGDAEKTPVVVPLVNGPVELATASIRTRVIIERLLRSKHAKLIEGKAYLSVRGFESKAKTSR